MSVFGTSRKSYPPALVSYPEPAPSFDIYDDDLMHDVMGNERLAKPVQGLLITLDQINMTHGSFGKEAMNAQVAMDAIVPLLKALRAAVKEQWQEDQ